MTKHFRDLKKKINSHINSTNSTNSNGTDDVKGKKV